MSRSSLRTVPAFPRHPLPEPSWHRRSDTATGILLQTMVVLSPWTFGSWPAWSVWALNLGGYLLGVLLLLKVVIRRTAHYEPRRWNGTQPLIIPIGLGLVTAVLLSGCLVSAINARAVVDLDHLRLLERPHWIPWLPHSYDQPATWAAFWSYLGLAGAFWALRDWITLVPPEDRPVLNTEFRSCRAAALGDTAQIFVGQHPLGQWRERDGPDAKVGQRVLQPVLFDPAVEHVVAGLVGENGFFGPFTYRNHAAQFVNLVWPLCLALWLAHPLPPVRQSRRSAWILPFCLVLMIAASFVSGSRGGSIITALLLATCLPLLFLGPRTGRQIRFLAGITAVAGLGLGLGLAWEPLRQRFFRDLVVYPTRIETGLSDFTIRATFRVPTTWGKEIATFAGLSDDPKWLWNTPGSITLSLHRSGVLQARVVGPDPSRVLMLTAADKMLVDAGRTVEIIFTRRSEAATLHLNGQPVELRAPKPDAAITWPGVMASKYLWIGRGSGGSRKFNDRIEAVTLLDRALPTPVIESLANRNPKQAPIFRPFPFNDRWADLDPSPVLDIAPNTLAPSQWLATGLGGRTEIHRLSRAMMADHPPVLGTGPGSFAGLFKIFRQNRDPRMDWYAHNDHLETRITFGLVGTALIYLGLLLCPLATLTRGGMPLPRHGLFLIGISLAGALFHARFDWLFQNHSLPFLALLVCGNPNTPDST